MIYLEADVWAPGKGKNDPYALAPVPQEQILLLGSPLSICVSLPLIGLSSQNLNCVLISTMFGSVT